MSALEPLTKRDLDLMRVLVPEHAGIIERIRLEDFLLAYALRRHGTLYAVGGFTRTDDPGTYVIWLMVTPAGRQHPMALGLGCKRAFLRALPFAERLEACVRADTVRDMEFLEAFGFVYEGPEPETFHYNYAWTKAEALAWQQAGH